MIEDQWSLTVYMPNSMWPILTFASLASCSGEIPDTGGSGGGSSDTGSSEGGEAGGDSGGDPGGEEGGGDGGPDPSQAPRILDGDIWCYEHNTGEIRYYWTLLAEASDPQGDETLVAVYEGLGVRQGSALIATYAVVCNSGSCTASFEEVEDSVLCSNASSYSFLLEVMDEDNNVSSAYEMTGRVGSNASGR